MNDGNDFKEYFVCFSYHHIYNCKLTTRTVGRIKFRGRFTQKALQRRQHHPKEKVVKFLFEREDNLKLIFVWKIKYSMHSSADIKVLCLSHLRKRTILTLGKLISKEV